MAKPDSSYRPELDSDNFERLNKVAQEIGISMTVLVNQLLRNINIATITTEVEMKQTRLKSGNKIIIVDRSKSTDYSL